MICLEVDSRGSHPKAVGKSNSSDSLLTTLCMIGLVIGGSLLCLLFKTVFSVFGRLFNLFIEISLLMIFGIGTSESSCSSGSPALEYDDRDGGMKMIPFSVSIFTVVSGLFSSVVKSSRRAFALGERITKAGYPGK